MNTEPLYIAINPDPPHKFDAPALCDTLDITRETIDPVAVIGSLSIEVDIMIEISS